MIESFVQDFIENAIFRLDENNRMVRKSFAELAEADIWKRPNAASNSVGNLILHLCGNITQYAISALSDTADRRQRDAEFAAREGHGKAELLVALLQTVETAKTVIRKMDADNLMRMRNVQGFRFSGTGIILHVVEHYSYHTGQIAFWTKLLKEKDLGFYTGFDLNAKNEP